MELPVKASSTADRDSEPWFREHAGSLKALIFPLVPGFPSMRAGESINRYCRSVKRYLKDVQKVTSSVAHHLAHLSGIRATHSAHEVMILNPYLAAVSRQLPRHAVPKQLT